MDYHRLNAITKPGEFPLPHVDDSLDLLAGIKYFTTLDLATGYWQVGMTLEAQEKTAFVTHEGLYKFSVMPFGLCNVPTTFQRLMEVTLRGLVRHKCVVYLDDIMVMGKTFKPKKCHLMKREVTHLGYVVSESGILAPGKVKAVRDLPASRDLSNYGLFWALPLLSDINTPIFSYVSRRGWDDQTHLFRK